MNYTCYILRIFKKRFYWTRTKDLYFKNATVSISQKINLKKIYFLNYKIHSLSIIVIFNYVYISWNMNFEFPVICNKIIDIYHIWIESWIWYRWLYLANRNWKIISIYDGNFLCSIWNFYASEIASHSLWWHSMDVSIFNWYLPFCLLFFMFITWGIFSRNTIKIPYMPGKYFPS